MDLTKKIRSIPHWPIDPVTFRDITTLLQDPEAYKWTCDKLYDRYQDKGVQKIVGIDARGFVFGAVLAYKLGVGFVPVRKKGKLPADTVAQEFDLEYGTDTVELHVDALGSGDRVVLVDDLLATGGTIAAIVELVRKLGAEIVEVAFVIELTTLDGRAKLPDLPIHSLVEFEVEE